MDGLVATGVVVRFGGLVALAGVDVDAPPARITGLVGPNGAGKTTLFNVCCGYRAADEGKVVLDGVDVTTASPARRARLGLGRTFQRMQLFRSLSVRENVELAAESAHVGDDPLSHLGVRGAGRRVRRHVEAVAGEALEATGLTTVAHRLAGEVSTGHGRLLEVARALARRPRVLLLDEPSSGLDAAESRAFGQLLRRLVDEQGLGVLMVEHDMALVLAICDWVQVLDFGRPLMAGTPAEVRASDVVRHAYLGKLSAA